jgi:hypothetical protein
MLRPRLYILAAAVLIIATKLTTAANAIFLQDTAPLFFFLDKLQPRGGSP